MNLPVIQRVLWSPFTGSVVRVWSGIALYVLAVLVLLATAGGTAAADLTAAVKDSNGNGVEDAVVVAVPVEGMPIPATRPADEIVDQVDKEFVPYVKPILVGSLVRFPNKDNVHHQVYSFSGAKRFELSLYGGTSAPPVLFDKPGVVVLGCNIHDWMTGYIYVAETPYFGKTGPDGSTRIRNLPPGQYIVRVWHPRMDASEESTNRRMTVTAAGVESVAWTLPLKPDFRIHRAPMPGGGGYH